MSRFLVVGAGGIGGVVAAHLVEQGHDVTVLSTNALIADAVNAFGFRVRGEASPGTVKGKVALRLRKSDGKFDFVLLATQPPQVEQAATSVLDWLADTGAMVCFQNGLCEERVAMIAGKRNVIGAVVAWGASMVEPGIYDRTSAGGFQIGRLDGGEDERLRELARVLECIGPTLITKNLLGSRWSKLAINCAISSLGTVGGDRLGVLMRQRHVRRLALEIMTEVTETARALGVRMEKVAGTIDLEWIALTEADRASLGSPILMAKHALLLAVGARYRRLRSSMLAAIERGRPPSVDFLNGEVITRAMERGLSTPINSAIREEVLRIARGKARSSHQLLRAFYESTRSLVGPGAKESVRPGVAGASPVEEAKPPAITVETGPLPQALEATIDSPADAELPTAVLPVVEPPRVASPASAPLVAPAMPDAPVAEETAADAPVVDPRVEPPASHADLPVLAETRAKPHLEREKAETIPTGPPSHMSISTKKGVPRLDSERAPADAVIDPPPPAALSDRPAPPPATGGSAPPPSDVPVPAIVPPVGPTGTMSLKVAAAAPVSSAEHEPHSGAATTERDAAPPSIAAALEDHETIIDPAKLPPHS